MDRFTRRLSAPFFLLCCSTFAFAEDANNSTPYLLAWADQQHQHISSELDEQANRLNNVFGTPAPDKPAQASIRIILDNQWQEHGGYHVEPRIRGSIHLPTLEDKFKLVFGDEVLDDEHTTVTPLNSSNQRNTVVSKTQTREDNSSVALRWLGLNNQDLHLNLDVGLLSHFDVYAKAKVSHRWQLQPNLQLYGEQIVRYGQKSKGYYRTFFDLHYQTDQLPDMLDQTVLLYAQKDKQQGLYWENRPFFQQSFFPNQTFSYGVMVSGHTEHQSRTINSDGPWLSWRQPMFRPWFFVQTDVNYFNNEDAKQSHGLGVLLRLETVF